MYHDMMLFVEVARTGSFSRASSNLSIPGATLSRRIAAMEREFGVRLFDRNTRRVVLTEAGRRYFDRCGRLVDEARLAHRELLEAGEQPSGHIRISMPVDLGVTVIGPLLADFSRQFAGISFDLDLSPHHANFVGDHFDMAIRLGTLKDDSLVARRVGSVEQRLFAAPTYLSLHGTPVQPTELVDHQCIVIPSLQRQALWRLKSEADSVEVLVRGRFMVNNVGMMRVLAERGMGIALLAPSVVRESLAEGRLVQLLPDWLGPQLQINAVMSSRMQPASVRALLDFLAARL